MTQMSVTFEVASNGTDEGWCQRPSRDKGWHRDRHVTRGEGRGKGEGEPEAGATPEMPFARE